MAHKYRAKPTEGGGQRTVSVEQFCKLAKQQRGKPARNRLTRAEYFARFMATPLGPLPGSGPDIERELFERHDRAAFSLRLPLAPTVDHFLILPKHNRRFVYSGEARAYREAVAQFWRRYWKGWVPDPLTGRLRLLVLMGAARRGRWDISNRIKPLEDALTHCQAWEDDSQIDDLQLLRGPLLPPTGYMDVTVEVIR